MKKHANKPIKFTHSEKAIRDNINHAGSLGLTLAPDGDGFVLIIRGVDRVDHMNYKQLRSWLSGYAIGHAAQNIPVDVDNLLG